MLTGLAHLGLEVKSLDRARAFYCDRLGLDPVAETPDRLSFRVGDDDLHLRRPTGVPRGGLHVHYAFTTPESQYDDWRDRLADLDPDEHQFGSYRSLYVDDPDDHCVEVGGIGEMPPDAATAPRPLLTGIFEIVLEVADLAAAEARYTALGFEVVDRGEDRRRVRLRGPFDLELWEPQLGLADARGGVHVDLGLYAPDPEAAVAAVGADPETATEVPGGVRVEEADCHRLTFLQG
jgi:catechol 2,3-dioxygenase-like lactoylglutathione lyase family enzyme